MKLNKEWHMKNKMSQNPSRQQRLKWHKEHVKHCKCRSIPKKLLEQMKNA